MCRWLISTGVALALGAAVACGPTVGDRCTPDDLGRARAVVHRRDGTPAYAGQALLLTSCGTGTFCHSEGTTERHGAPFGLDFDAELVDELADVESAEARLLRTQRVIAEHRDAIYAAVVGGSMPPGEVGRLVDQRETNPYATYASDDDTMGVELPPIGSAEGAEILRNWLACGVPVVERTTEVAPATCASDADCTVTRRCDTVLRECAEVGATECRRPVVIAPVWSEIHPAIVRPGCVAGCHVSGGLNETLDLSSADAALLALVDRPSDTAGCGVLIAPGDPDESLLVAKLEGTAGAECGDRMPLLGAALPGAQIALVREWIANGATAD